MNNKEVGKGMDWRKENKGIIIEETKDAFTLEELS